MVTTIDDYAARPKRTQQEDGLWDMVGGITLFAISLINYAAIRSINTMHGADFTTSPAYQNGNNFFILSIFLANAIIMVSYHAIEPLKRRFIYPRLGYVQPRVVPPNRRRMILAVSLLVGIVHMAAFRFVRWDSLHFWTSDMSLIGIGMGFGIGLVLNFLKVGFVRHLIVAGVSVIASIVLASVHLDWLHSSLGFALILGTSLIVSGAVPFLKIARTPLITGGDTE